MLVNLEILVVSNFHHAIKAVGQPRTGAVDVFGILNPRINLFKGSNDDHSRNR